MNPLRKEIEELENTLYRKKEELKRLEENCHHVWGDSVYNPETYYDQVTDGYEGHGSDFYPITRRVEKKKSRWSQTCTKCGKTRYAYNQKAVKFEPDFGN